MKLNIIQFVGFHIFAYYLEESYEKGREMWDQCICVNLWYISLSSDEYLYVELQDQFSEFQWDNGDGDVGGDGENFLIGKCCENEMT